MAKIKVPVRRQRSKLPSLGEVKLPPISQYVEDELKWTDSDLAVLTEEFQVADQLPLEKKTLSVISQKRAKKLWLRSQPFHLPKLNKRESDHVTCSIKHNSCLDLLKEGFPRAFTELFDLLKEHVRVQEALGPTSPLYYEPPLETDQEKVNQLYKFLSKAEEADRKRTWVKAYQAKKKIALYFRQAGEDWLAKHFFFSALQTALRIRSDGGRRLAEANGFVGLVYEKEGYLDKACEHFWIMNNMTEKNKEWLNMHYKPMHEESCLYIARIYTTMAEAKQEKGELSSALQLYLKALKMTKKAKARFVMIKVYFKLGHMYKSKNDLKKAMLFFRKLVKICKEVGEFRALCDTYEAMADIHTSRNELEKGKEYLRKFAYNAERHNLSEELIKASFLIGKAMSVTQASYEAAWQNFLKSFFVAQRLGNRIMGDKIRIHCAVAYAHHVTRTFSGLTTAKERYDFLTLLSWKVYPSPNEAHVFMQKTSRTFPMSPSLSSSK